jgi:histidinol-phosphate aminotransferase
LRLDAPWGCGTYVDLNGSCDPGWLGSLAFDLASTVEKGSPQLLMIELRQRIACAHRVPVDSVHLFASIDGMILELLRKSESPIVGFPPSASAALVSQIADCKEHVMVLRGVGRDGAVGSEVAADLPSDGIALIDSPSDPLGSILLPTDAVRLARACKLVIIDERYAEFSNFTLRGLASEFPNIVILRSYERWLGHNDVTCGWAIAPPEFVARFELTSGQVNPAAMAASIALLSEPGVTESTARIARQERSRLYRLLRKFSFISPLPSWGPFMSARINVVPRDTVVQAFLDRGIRVHTPNEPGLESFIRISIGSRSAMERFRQALLEMSPELLG